MAISAILLGQNGLTLDVTYPCMESHLANETQNIQFSCWILSTVFQNCPIKVRESITLSVKVIDSIHTALLLPILEDFETKT